MKDSTQSRTLPLVRHSQWRAVGQTWETSVRSRSQALTHTTRVSLRNPTRYSTVLALRSKRSDCAARKSTPKPTIMCSARARRSVAVRVDSDAGVGTPRLITWCTARNCHNLHSVAASSGCGRVAALAHSALCKLSLLLWTLCTRTLRKESQTSATTKRARLMGGRAVGNLHRREPLATRDAEGHCWRGLFASSELVSGGAHFAGRAALVEARPAATESSRHAGGTHQGLQLQVRDGKPALRHGGSQRL